MSKPITPLLTVDVVALCQGDVLLIERANPPHGWALPGGFVDVGERLLDAAARELEEETGVVVKAKELTFLGMYDDPKRDKRGHTVTAAFVIDLPAPRPAPHAATDAKRCEWFALQDRPATLFDHESIIADAMTKLQA